MFVARSLRFVSLCVVDVLLFVGCCSLRDCCCLLFVDVFLFVVCYLMLVVCC